MIFNFVFWVAASAANEGFEGDFDSSAISVYLGSVSVTLATALLLSRVYRMPAQLLLFATALTASDPVFDPA